MRSNHSTLMYFLFVISSLFIKLSLQWNITYLKDNLVIRNVTTDEILYQVNLESYWGSINVKFIP